MLYADIQMFMDKLKQLIYCNDNPLINNPSIVYERPQFLLLYEEVGSMIQTLLIHEDQNFEKIRNQTKRFKAAAEEAEDIVDLFLSTVHFRNNGYFPRSDVFHPSLHLEVVMRSIKSIKMEFMTKSIDNMKMHSSQRTDTLQIQSTAAGTSHSRNSIRSKKALEEIVVGLDHDVELIRDKLVEDRRQLDVVSIVGMGGIGKTTLASKVFSDPFVVYHFYVRAWVTVSQTYEKRDLLIQILSSMGVQLLDLENTKESRLREMLHKSLKGKRYLIVIDDIWSIKAWVKLKLVFPDDETGSRILLTSRLTEVASQVKSDGFVHQLQYLTEEQSWELLCGKVFQGDECPKWLVEPGMRITKNCHGLPLSLVVIAGVLAKEARRKDSWEKVAFSSRSYIAGDQRGCLETLALSYHHLPNHLRECFLYLGGFSEDSRILVQRLIWLWMAEGFIQEDGCRSSQEIAEGYIMDLVDRNLVIVVERKFNGDVRVCKLHDLVRELCVEKAKEERFFLTLTDMSLPFDVPSRKCFLYLLTKIKRYSWIPVESLILSWICDGLIHSDGSRSLKEIAEGYLMDLVHRKLVIVEKLNLEGDVRFCKVSNLAWKLWGPNKQEGYGFFTNGLLWGPNKQEGYGFFKNGLLWGPNKQEGYGFFTNGLQRDYEVINTYKQRRVFTNHEFCIENSTHLPSPSIRSLLCFDSKTTLIDNIAQFFHSFALLRVLDLPNYKLVYFPPEISFLVHLRYLSIRHSFFPSLICNLRSLQTLIMTTTYSSMVLPSHISNLVNLKNLWSDTELYLPSIRKPMNLETISNVMLGDGVENFQKCFPIIKKLACTLYSDVKNDFELLLNLQTLKLTGLGSPAEGNQLSPKPHYGKKYIRFPTSLKKLTVVRCRLRWSDMSIIQSLPNLEALRLIDNGFEGTLWETGEEQFQKLKFLRLEELNLKQWEASSINFPCLKRLLVVKCKDLEEIPLEIGDISTLEFLEADGCGASLNTSLGKIRQEQDDVGNCELKIKVDGREYTTPEYVLETDSDPEDDQSQPEPKKKRKDTKYALDPGGKEGVGIFSIK